MTTQDDLTIRPFAAGDEEAALSLWEECGLTRAWNDPRKDIARKLAVQPELFLVGVSGGRVVATVMAGYDGHRGWINYLGIAPAHRRKGWGRRLMEEAQKRLLALGCPKVNLQVRAGNRAAIEFYQRLGYRQDDVVSMGKRLVPD